MNDIRITGTKWFVKVEYVDCIARFDGEMCVDDFYAIASSISWIKHIGSVTQDDVATLIEAVMQINKKNAFKVYFVNDNGSVWSQLT